MSTDWGAAQWGDSEGNPVVSDSETPALPAPIDAPADLDGIDQHGTDLDFAEMGLGELAAMANEYHTKAEGSARSALEAAWIAGSALLAAKDQLGHGEWLPWVQANFYGSRQTAADYMRIAKNVGNADNVVSSLHLENTTQSINAALNAISKSTRTPGPKPDNNPKPLTPKQ
jgi:hypothetical protein